MTSRIAALDMVRVLLQSAENTNSHVIATVCPLCQVNLECYQATVNEEFGTDFNMPILYFTQLLGLALGLSPKDLGIGIELVSATPVFKELLPKEVN
jgi:heterodisulfide reductase subunit B